VNLKAVTGAYTGETASWGMRFALGGGGSAPFQDRPNLDAGQINLNTFDCHTDVKTRGTSPNSVAGSLSQLWSGDAAPTAECVTENDIDFFITKGHDLWTAARPSIPNTYALDNIKLYAVGQDGKAPLGPNMWVATALQQGSSSSTFYSPEVACCVSWYSAARTKGGRGRLFLGPLHTTATSSDGLFTSAFKTTIGNAAKAVQDSVRTRGTPSATAVYCGIVWNRSPGNTGAVINRVRIGDEIDRQERRTRGRPETFTDFLVV
jgi:hypothetical protein